MAKWHNLDSYGFFKDVRQSFEAMSDESAGGVIKALLALDDGESVDLSGKSETVKSVLPTLAQSMMRCQIIRAKNGKKLIVTPEKVVLDVVSGVVSWVVSGVVSGVVSDLSAESEEGTPIPEPIPSPDEYMCIQTDGSEQSVPFIPERTGIFADEAIREKWCRYVLDTRVKNGWSNNPSWLKVLAGRLEEYSGGDVKEADALLDYVIQRPFGNFFKLNRKTYDKQTEKPFADVPEDWDQIGGGQ